MKYLYSLLVGAILVLFSGCGKSVDDLNPFTTSKKVYGFSFIEGKVIEIFGDKVIVEIEDKDIVSGSSYEDKLTNKVIKSSLFIAGMNTFIGKEKAYVSDIRGKQITFKIKDTKLKNGQDIKIYIPKKTIAVMDFSLIGIKNSSIDKFALEDMTTKFVQSGQYVVVERAKLETILKEQKLADSGLLDERSASKVGKLVSADIILTGTFAKRGNKWSVNLRLVDVSTGIILAAINEKVALDEFRPKQAKDSSNLTESFEDKRLSKGWVKNLVNKNGSKSKGSIDKTTGANGTTSSYRIDYFLTKQKSVATLVNKRMRDISGFRGIKFYAKASSPTTLSLVMLDQNFDNSYNNKWIYPVSIDNSWAEYKVPFDEFILGKGHARSKPGGDGVLDLDNIERINIGIIGKLNTINEKNTVWVDEITLY